MVISNTEGRKNTFAKAEKLCSIKSIDYLFVKGDSFIAYPLRVVYSIKECVEETEESGVSVLVSVSKKKFKRAVKRNRVKRLIREAYRLNKFPYIDTVIAKNKHIDIAFLYLKSELPTYEEIEKSMLKALGILESKLLEEKKE